MSEVKRVSRVSPWKRELVTKVIRCYRDLRNLPEITAINIDPTPGSQSKKKSANSIHYTVDVRNSLAAAIEGQSDRPELIKAWTRLLADENVIDPIQARLIDLLAPILRTREIEPWLYFAGTRT